MTGNLRQRLVIIVAVLAFNLLATFCLAIAIAHFIFKDEWIIGIVPGAIALTAIILQPWSLLFWLLPPVTHFLHPFVTTALTIVIYGWLNRQGRLYGIKNLLSRFRGYRLWQAVLLALLTAFGVTYARYRDFPAFNRQPPSIIKDTLERDRISVTDSYSYTVSSFLDSDYIWQARISPQNFAKLRVNLGLQPLQLPQRLPKEFQGQSPYWWQPVLSAKTRVYATPGFSFKDRGQDGVHVFLIWNSETQKVNLWLKNNF